MIKWFSIFCLFMVFSFTGIFLWYNEWRNNLQTPVAEQYHDVKLKKYIDSIAVSKFKKDRPVFLYFFNPGCPCSGFNMSHFKSLVAAYSDKGSFEVVVTKDKNYIPEKYGLTESVVSDTTQAGARGIYSTTKPVLLNTNHSLYYCGSCNSSSYCTDKKSSYSQTAIDSLLVKKQHPVFNRYAVTACGCSLPCCTK